MSKVNVLFYSSLVLIAGSLFSSRALAQSEVDLSSHKIRVRTLNEVKAINIDGFGIRLYPSPAEMFESALPKKRNIKIERKQGRWLVTVDFGKYTIDSLELQIDGTFMKVNGEAYADDLKLLPYNSRFSVIANMEMEDYLKGVVPSEMPVQWPIEALKAQVVTARSYAYSMILRNRGLPYDVDDTTAHQVFYLRNFQGANIDFKNKINRAISETDGVYLASEDGGPYLSYYHSDCGGETEEPENIWGQRKKYGTVKDSFCSTNSKNKWEYSISKSEVLELIRKFQGIKIPISLDGLDIKSHSKSGRAHLLLLKYKSQVGEKNAMVLSKSLKITAEDLRKFVGYRKIKSSQFKISETEKGFKLVGKGMGHGAGMCQSGARFMALAGSDFNQIVKRYYPRAKVKKVSFTIGKNL